MRFLMALCCVVFVKTLLLFALAAATAQKDRGGKWEAGGAGKFRPVLHWLAIQIDKGHRKILFT